MAQSASTKIFILATFECVALSGDKLQNLRLQLYNDYVAGFYNVKCLKLKVTPGMAR